jgi:HD-GYP domain-containing protein (c-di-GMP phosphodiesterase class II)
MLVAEELVDQARTRRTERMAPRERVVLRISAGLFLAAAAAVALSIPDERGVDWPVLAILVVGYLVVGRVRFEFAGHYGTAEQLLIIPILALAPLPFVPLIIGLSSVVATGAEVLRRREHGEQAVAHLADCWFCVPPVLVLAAMAPGAPQLDDAGVYAVVFAAQMAGDLSWALIRNSLLDRIPLRPLASFWLGSSRIDAIFTPLAFLIAVAAVDAPTALLTIAPLTFLLHSFARDREERWANAVELHRAYRGTVMLLSDVVESEDSYTAEHSRSVVELVNAVADELGVAEEDRRELEFAAMLHDVGKIAIPNEILNKPSTLEPGEFEVMKTHTIEGQFLLDRVGGLLGRVGQIVRSCHERWDGGGYPDGLAGENIPFASRIVFCCDAYNAMTSDRVYRKALPVEHALRELEENAGSQFDPTVVTALIRVIRDGSPVSSGSTDEVRAMLATMPARASAPGV